MRIDLADIKDFTGKVVLVTGGASGIGLASVRLLASKGAQVVVGDLRPPPATNPPDPKQVTYITTDAASWDSQLHLFKETLKRHGRLDVVFVNAAIAEGEHAFEDRCDPTTGDPLPPKWTTLTVNLMGALITTKLALHYLRKAETGGAIVLTGSRASYDAYNMPVYTATKHGMLGLMRALRQHTPSWKIRINLVAPGVTFTDLLPATTRTQYERLGLYMQPPEDVARAVAWLAQEETWNGRAISVSQAVYRELEEPLEGLKGAIYGEDDFVPKTNDEFLAYISALESRW